MRIFLIAVLCIYPSLVLAQQFGTGLKFLEEDAYSSIPLATTPLLGDLPDTIDLSRNFPPPGNQGQQGSCVGWALAYALKGYQEKVERKWDGLSEGQNFSPAYIFNQIKINGCSGGSYIKDGLNAMRNGVATLKDFSYTDSSCELMPDAAVRQSAKPFAIADWRRVNVQDPVEVKSQLAAGFPVVIGMMVDDGFMKLSREIYSERSGRALGGHALVVVGYDDNFQAYKVINSWGTDWGDNGYGRISYSVFSNVVKEGYTAQDIVSVHPDAPPNPSDDPPPTPTPNEPSASVNLSAPVYDVLAPTYRPQPTAPGVMFYVDGNIIDAYGHNMQVVLRFSDPFSNRYIFANPNESAYRDTTGLVAIGGYETTVNTNDFPLKGTSFMVPYYAFNFAPTNFSNVVTLDAIAQIYIDRKLVKDSLPMRFSFRW